MRKPRGERNSFLTPLVVEVMPNGKRFRLFLPFTFADHGLKITVPAGFVTDLASIPASALLALAAAAVVAGRYAGLDWLLWIGVAIVVLGALIPKLGRQNKAAVVHDYLYRIGLEAFRNPRKFADRVFLRGMVALSVASWKRRLMYWGVRAFGWAAWRKRK